MVPSTRPRRAWLVLLAVVLVVCSVVVGTLAALGAFSPRTATSAKIGTVVFLETGLVPGTTWSVSVENSSGIWSSQSVTVGEGPVANNTLAFLEPNGQYSYDITAWGYSPDPLDGTIHVAGTNAIVEVPFRIITDFPTVFILGTAVEGNCAPYANWAINGCTPGDYVYDLSTVEAPTIPFDGLRLTVTTASGANYSIPGGPGGFTLMSSGYALEAQISSSTMSNHLWMSGGWQTYNGTASPSAYLTDGTDIRIDLGNVDPSGLGLVLEVYGTDGFTGATSPLVLS